MARLPDETVLGPAPSALSRRPIPTLEGSAAIAAAGVHMGEAIERGGAAIGQGLASLSEGAKNLAVGASHLVKAQDDYALQRAEADYHIRKAQVDTEFENDRDYPSYVARYQTRLSEVTAEIGRGIDRANVQERFKVWSEPRDAYAIGAAAARAKKIETDVSLAQDMEREVKLREQGLTSPDPVVRMDTIETAKGLIDRQYARGYITAVQAQAKKQAWVLDYARASVALLPEEEQIRTLSGVPAAGSITTFIPADERERLLDRAVMRLAQRDARQERIEAKAQKKINEDTLKEAFSRASKSTLTPEYVEQIRPWLSPNEYKGLLKTLNAEDNVDDAEAIADLVRKIDSVDTEEFQKSAVSYMQRGKLKTSTYISLSEKNRTASKDDAPASPYRSGRDLVKGALDPGQLLSGPAAGMARLGMTQALIEYDNWMQANPRAERADAVAQAQEIVRRYEIVKSSDMKSAIGLSRYFGPKSKDEVTSTDIDAAEIKLYQDIEGNRLSKPQAEFEIRLLENWRGIVTREQRARERTRDTDRGRPKR